jgi:hypothetical protein
VVAAEIYKPKKYIHFWKGVQSPFHPTMELKPTREKGDWEWGMGQVGIFFNVG